MLRQYKLVTYARVGGDTEAVITNFKHLERLQIPAYGVEDSTTSTQLIDFVKKVQQSGGLGIFMFHGIGGDYITISPAVHQALINYLKENSNDIWVPTF